MAMVRIEHRVMDYETWKGIFDSDPVGRERVGVRRYEVMRALEDPNLVCIDLDFDTTDAAEGFVGAMREIWDRVTGTLVEAPTARIVTSVESHRYR